MTALCANNHGVQATADERLLMYPNKAINSLFEALLKTIDNQPKLYRAARLYLQES